MSLYAFAPKVKAGLAIVNKAAWTEPEDVLCRGGKAYLHIVIDPVVQIDPTWEYDDWFEVQTSPSVEPYVPPEVVYLPFVCS